MADSTVSPVDDQVVITVKGQSDAKYNVTISTAATVRDLKEMLSSETHANLPADRQRLIYSGRVLKDNDTIASTNIKSGHTVHLVRSAESNTRQNPASGSQSAAIPAVPTNIAAGTGNSPLAGLTGARYAGFHGLPNMSAFGPDGGVGVSSMSMYKELTSLDGSSYVGRSNGADARKPHVRLSVNRVHEQSAGYAAYGAYF